MNKRVEEINFNLKKKKKETVYFQVATWFACATVSALHQTLLAKEPNKSSRLQHMGFSYHLAMTGF